MNLHNGGEPASIDPAHVNESVGSDISLALHDGLYEYPEGFGDALEPSLALKTEIDDSKTVYTFTLRPEAKWSDGTPLTAHDFVYSWRRVLKPETAAKYAFALFYLKNGRAYHQGDITDATQVGVKALDDYTLQATLENPTPYFLYWLAYPVYRPAPQHVIEKHGDQWTRPGKMVSSGPFMLNEWVTQERVGTKKNPHFWDAANVKAPGINFWLVESQETAVRMFEAGELDIVRKVPVKSVPKLKKRSDYQIAPYLASYYYHMNVEKAPFDNVLVRRAFARAVDRETLCDKFQFGTCFAWDNLVPKGMDNYPYAKGPKYDPEKARALLAEAGYPGGKGFPSVTLNYNTDENHRMIAQVIQNMLKVNLGVEIQLANEEWKTLGKRLQKGDFQMARMGWIGDYPDPTTFLEVFLHDSQMNYSQWRVPAFGEGLRKTMAMTNPEERLAALGKLEQMFLDAAPVIPLYSYSSIMLIRESLKHYKLNLQNAHPLRRVYIE